MNSVGSLKLYVGCMFAGKSSAIVTECRKRLAIGQKVLGINYSGDSRYSEDNFIVTHSKEKINCVKVLNLSSIDINTIIDNDFIFIDEGQFFTDLVDNVLTWVNKYNKSVYVFGLDGDFKRELFGDVIKLIPHCDEIEKLKALCVMCKDGTEALFTHRLTGGEDQVLIGTDNYVALCRHHYNELN